MLALVVLFVIKLLAQVNIIKQCCFLQNLMLFFASNFFSQYINLFFVSPRVPITAGTTTPCGRFQILFTFCLTLVSLFTFFCSFSLKLLSPVTAVSIRWHLVFIFYSTSISDLLCQITRSVWMLKSQNIFTSSFVTTFSGLWLHHIVITPNYPKILE